MLFTHLHSYNFPADLLRRQYFKPPTGPKPEKSRPQPACDQPDSLASLLKVLDRHPDIRLALLKALESDRAQGIN